MRRNKVHHSDRGIRLKDINASSVISRGYYMCLHANYIGQQYSKDVWKYCDNDFYLPSEPGNKYMCLKWKGTVKI